ncbi:biotin holocarboxylase synthetase [Entomophthora muscae]|uniref:Biotin holocarboxylase synthetase n=1 Tax=Entomophthora muscae TaxID=34485 RepID=A0ACC2UBH6_9FUNG|nr:biotin holocarboxylase synthetase [Entomophthora muscae]
MEHLAGEGNIRIRTFVENGGKFIGFCAGAYYSCGRVEFELGTKLQMAAVRPLKFFPGLGRGAAFRGFDYESEDGARAAPITFEFLQAYPTLKCPVYWDGGGAFINAHLTSNVSVLATYDAISDESENAAAVLCKVGDKGGEALLSFVHPEYKPNANFPHLFNELNTASPEIEEILFRWLNLIGFSVNQAFERQHPTSPIQLMFFDGLPQSNNMESPTEAFAYATKAYPNTPVEGSSCYELEIPPPIPGAKALKLIVNPDLETLSASPFQIKAYSEALMDEIPLPSNCNSFGSPLLYAEVTTSTQRIFQENRYLLSALPSGAVFVASRQVAGKGRGTNVWVSPLGCLQFSLYLKHPLPDRGASVVLVQYLTAVAIVEAVRTKPGYEHLPLHIKWPNDIYGMSPSSARLNKIGGILVNTMYTKDSCNVIVGVGLNVTNSHPTLCINDLITQMNKERSNRQGLPSLPLFTQEELLARILSQLQTKYSDFITQQAGFTPFLDSYYRYWLHGDQTVTLSARGVNAKITGIQPHSGFLNATSVDGERYELQPDGNSFDMMTGLISTKVPYSTPHPENSPRNTQQSTTCT